MPTAATVATIAATIRTIRMDSSNMACASAALLPCSIISRVNVSPPTTRTPRLTMPTPRALAANAATAIRNPTLRVQAGRDSVMQLRRGLGKGLGKPRKVLEVDLAFEDRRGLVKAVQVDKKLGLHGRMNFN